MRVVVAGAGLGGLALASGLARDGHAVVVLEADASPASRPQGYRIHLDSRGLDPLRDLLPPAHLELVEATAGEFLEPRRLQVLTGRLRPLRTVATGPGSVGGRLISTAVDRGTLRAVLLDAAVRFGAEIRWGTTISGFTEEGSCVRVHTSRGPADTLESDLLVGSDGPRSTIAAQRLPGRSVDVSRSHSIVGRAPLAAVSPRLLDLVRHGYVVLRGLRTGVGLGLLAFGTPPDRAGARAQVTLPPMADYLMWNVGRPGPATDRERREGPEALQRKAVRLLRTWHPDVRSLIAASLPGETFLAPAYAARRPPPWAPSRVTVIGDALHAMPPDRGSGANLALADAAGLVAALRSAHTSGAAALLEAVAQAERAMLARAFAVSEAGPAF